MMPALRLPFRSTRQGDRASVTIRDPIFGPVRCEVHPFLRGGGQPIGGAQGELRLGERAS